MMSLNTVKYKGELLAEDNALPAKSPGVLGEYKELRADALEADTLDITVLSDSGTIRNFKKNDKVEYFRSGSRVGVYYLQSVTRVGPKLYTLSALSAVGLLIVRPHRGGIYTGQTVAEVVAEICGDIPVLIETVYRGIKLYGWLPIASARDSLVQVLFAIGAWLHTDENGTLRVQKLWNGTASIIGPGSVHAANIQVKYLDPVSAVAVTEHQYIAGTEDVTLFEGTAQQGDVIEFDEPAHTLTAEGFTVLESGANYAVLSAGTGKLTGKSYVHNRRVVTRTVTEGAAKNVEEIADATLVSLVNSSAVAQRMAAYYACREQLTVDVNPAAEHAGHVVSLWNEWDKQQTLACIASRETKISGLLKSRTSALVGFLPPQPESSEYFDERVILTGSGVWTVPEGVTELRAVVIGKGQDGTDGSSGTSSSSGFGQKNNDQTSWQPTASDNTRSISASASVTAGAAGKGGAGGVGGAGGKVLEASIQVTPGQKFSYAATDTESTFGALTSANGTASDTGFYDVVTQQFFARKGANGQNGADGGSDGKDGGSAGTASGGAGRTGGSSTDTKQDTSNSWLNAKLTLAWTLSGAGGGGAGGGSGDAVGTRGGDASYVYSDGAVGRITSLSFSNPSGFSFLADGYGYVYATHGGNGGDGANGIDGKNYGDGGGGGGGGGGAGKVGAASARCTLEGTAPYIHGDKPYQSLYVTAKAIAGGTANGGSAGTGGSGKPGCIILYYRKFGQVRSGPFVQRGGGLFFDRLNKLFIV
jgi:hypothetical protein